MATIRDSDLLYVQRGETPHNWTGLELKALVRATGKDGKLTVGNYLTPNGSTYDGSANLTINVDGSSGIEANKVVVRDAQGSFSGNVISANSFVGDGSQLTNAGAVLSDHSGTQRLVTTTLTSGAMVTAATSSDLSFTDTNATLNVGAGIKLLGTTGSATLTGSIDADSYIASDRAGDLSETFISQKEGISKLTIYNTGRVDTKSTINIATTNSSAINIFPSESIGTASIILQNNGNATFTGSLTIGGGNIQLNSNGNASFSGTVTANLIVGLKTLTRGNYLTGGNYNGQVAQTWNVDATVSNTGNKVVVRDASGNFSAGTITASLNGNASTASNADKLDGLDSTQFLRGDIDDTTSGTLTSTKADQAFIAQSNGTSNAWRGRILSKNSSSDRASFLGVYANKAGVFAHNHALSTWQDLYVNTVDATTGGNVRLPATTYVNGHAAVYNSGTWNINVTGSSTNAGYSTNSGYASNSDKCDGLHVHGGRNNEANKIVRTDGNGYAQFGWINTVSGVTNSGIARVYASQDDYIRYCSPDHLANSMTNVVKTAYNTSLNSDSRNSRGVTRLYRRDGDTDYSVQTYWSGSRWILYGYNGDTGHAPCQVSYADSAGSASNAGYANSAGSATNAGYANNSGNLQGHTWTSAGKDIRAKEFYAEGWFRNYDANEGVYNEATGGHFYASPGNGVWNLTGNTQNASTSLIFRGTHNGNVEGWIHANGTGWLGILNAAGQWALKSYNPDGHSPNLWFDEEGNETWTGNPGNDEGKIEYHSNRFYIASGGNSTEICRFRRGGSDKAWVANDGNMYLVGGTQAVYNSGTWGINITGSAGSATNAGYAGSAGYANSAGSAPANGGTSSAVTINYNNNSNSTYQMLWGSGNSVYGTGGIYCNPNANYIYASLFVGGLSGNASSATNAGYANSAGSATNAGYANSAGSATNADKLDGQHGSYYQNASNLNAGTINKNRIPGNLNGIAVPYITSTGDMYCKGNLAIRNSSDANMAVIWNDGRIEGTRIFFDDVDSYVTGIGDGNLDMYCDSKHIIRHRSNYQNIVGGTWTRWGPNIDVFPGANNTKGGACMQNSGTNSNDNGAALFVSNPGNIPVYINTNGNRGLVEFRRYGSNIGSIVCNATRTTYNTVSDYRLKENITTVSEGGLDKINQILVRQFNFKSDPDKSVSTGFIAHELQSVIPEAVTGVKDGMKTLGTTYNYDGSIREGLTERPSDMTYQEKVVIREGVEALSEIRDEYGKVTREARAAVEEISEMVTRTATWVGYDPQPDYQQVDQTVIVPTLVVSIQEISQRLNQIEQRLDDAGL